MREETAPLQRILSVGAWIVGIILFLRYLFPPLLPFLLALGLSALLEPWVQRFRNAAQVRRSFAAVVLTSVVLLVAGSIVIVLVLRLGEELAEWSSHLPENIAAFPVLWNSALARIESWYASCPPFIRSALDLFASVMGNNINTFVGKAGGFLMEKVSSLASRLPNASLFCITTILALYFTSISYSSILAFLKRQLPIHLQKRCRAAFQCCRTTILSWLRSELLLIFATFLILLLGFWWMRLPYAFLAAFSISLVDALPVLGTGSVLLPWAIFRFLLGDTRQGISLVTLYIITLLAHSFLESRLLAGQANLPPLAILLAMYLGYHLVGVGGMILLPIVLLLLKHLQDAGIVKVWK